MKSKITSLSKNEDFKSILNGKKISNKYLTIFFKKISNKDEKKLNISFVTKLMFKLLLFLSDSFLKKIVKYLFEIFLPLRRDLNSSFFERLVILLFIKL